MLILRTLPGHYWRMKKKRRDAPRGLLFRLHRRSLFFHAVTSVRRVPHLCSILIFGESVVNEINQKSLIKLPLFIGGAWKLLLGPFSSVLQCHALHITVDITKRWGSTSR